MTSFELSYTELNDVKQTKAVPLHAMEVLGEEEV
jgi:hypothetical protein